MEPARKLLTVSEFLDQYPDDGRHYQLLSGRVVAMAPPGSRHQVIAGTLGGELYLAVRRSLPGCSVRPQAGIAPYGVNGRDHFETDFAVACTPPSRGDRGIVEAPLLIVEILSPSNDRDDVFTKLPSYKRVPGLLEILYVETESVAATVYRRADDGRWREERLEGPSARLRLDSVGLELPLGQLYAGALPAS